MKSDPVIKLIKVQKKEDLDELKDKLKVLQQVRDEVNDSRLATSTDEKALSGTTGEIRAVQLLRKGNEPVVAAVEKGKEKDIERQKETEKDREKKRISRELHRLNDEMVSLLTRIEDAPRLQAHEKERLLHDFDLIRERTEELATDVSVLGIDVNTYIPHATLEQYRKLVAEISRVVSSKVSDALPSRDQLAHWLTKQHMPVPAPHPPSSHPAAAAAAAPAPPSPKAAAAAAAAPKPTTRQGTRGKSTTGSGVAQSATVEGHSPSMETTNVVHPTGALPDKFHNFKMTPEGRFGDLTIDLDALSRMSLKAYDAKGKLVLNKKVDPTLIDLITKRYNPKTKYTPTTVAAFRELVDKSNLPVRGQYTGKVKLLYQNGVCLPADITKDKAIDRLQLLAASLEAGNNAPQIRNEIADIITYLHKEGAITKKESERLFSDYVVG